MATSSQATTQGVQISVWSEFVPERSSPDDQLWFFVYHVRIENLGERTVQLESRHWVISDANAQVREVRGPGVVGEHPRLGPGDAFEYTSACPLPTPFGTMQGSYQMHDHLGEHFDAEIAPFALSERPLS